MVLTDRQLKTCINLDKGGYRFTIFNHYNEKQWEFVRPDFKAGKKHAIETMKKLQFVKGAL